MGASFIGLWSMNPPDCFYHRWMFWYFLFAGQGRWSNLASFWHGRVSWEGRDFLLQKLHQGRSLTLSGGRMPTSWPHVWLWEAATATRVGPIFTICYVVGKAPKRNSDRGGFEKLQSWQSLKSEAMRWWKGHWRSMRWRVDPPLHVSFSSRGVHTGRVWRGWGAKTTMDGVRLWMLLVGRWSSGSLTVTKAADSLFWQPVRRQYACWHARLCSSCAHIHDAHRGGGSH